MERGLRRGDPFLRVKFFLTASYEIDSDDFLMGLAEKLALDIWDAFRDMSSPFCWNSGPRLWIPQGGPFFWPLVWTHVKRKPLSTKPNQTKPNQTTWDPPRIAATYRYQANFQTTPDANGTCSPSLPHSGHDATDDL